MARPVNAVDLDALDLPAAFTARQADAAGLTRTVRARLTEDGTLDHFARGLYRRASAAPADLDLLEVALRSSRATICLASALGRHRLIDEIPPAIELALPRGTWHPSSPSVARWHTFDPDTFDIGRDLLTVDGSISLGIYSAERSIIDAFHTRGINGTDLALGALRRWLRLPGSQPGHLLSMAGPWPRAQAPLRAALEVLL